MDVTKDNLIGRLEAATGPDRELDAAIAQAFGVQGWTEGAMWFAQQIGAGEIVAPAFTASIDAALTLVPEGCFWAINQRGEAMVTAHGVDHWEESVTPALAIVIAALRAMP